MAAGLGEQLHDKRLYSHPAGRCYHHDSREFHLWSQTSLMGVKNKDRPRLKSKNLWKTFMNKIVSLALLVGGIVLIVIGINATNSFSSDVSRFFTGAPTDKAVWILIGGFVAVTVGLIGIFRGSKSA
jgi:hypothetical protein